MRAVGYARVSDESQVENYSLDAQRREIASYCKREGHELLRSYVDEGLSAHGDRIADRPQFAQMLLDAEVDQFDLVVVHTLDRFARNVGVQREALRRLGEAGIGFVSVSENWDFNTPAGRMMLTMMGGVAEFYSDQLAVHVAKGQRERALQGLPVGPVPWGYAAGRVSQQVPAEATALREAFERRAAGESRGTIADWLNISGFRTRKGNLFTAHAVRDILANRFYLGEVKYRGEQFAGQHEAIISEALWERAQRRKQPARTRHGRPVANAALRGRVSCVACGHPLHCETNSGGLVLYRERHACDCPTARGKAVVAHRIDATVGAVIAAIELRPDWRERIAIQAARRDAGEDVGALRAERRRVGRAYSDGTLDESEYEARLEAIDARIAATEIVAVPDLETVVALTADLGRLWECATAAERQQLVAPLVDRAYVDMGTKKLVRIAPAPAFRALIEAAARRTRACQVAVELFE